VHAKPPGTQVELDVDRRGHQQTFTAVLTPRPPGVT
jgi:hypothetical protein